MANYGKILGSEAFSKGTSYAQGVGAQERAIDTQTAELGKKQVAGMIDFAHKGYQLIKGAQKSKKMFDMLAGSQGYEKESVRDLSFLGNIATIGGRLEKGGENIAESDKEKKGWMWKDTDRYKKGDKYYSKEEAGANITQKMYDMIGGKSDSDPSEGGWGSKEYEAPDPYFNEARERGHFGDYKGLDILKGKSMLETIGWGKDKESKPPVEVKEGKIEEAPAEEIDESSNNVIASDEALDDGEVEVKDVEEATPAVEYNSKTGEHNNKISEAVGAPKGGLNDWLVSQGIKGKAEQLKWRKDKWIQLQAGGGG